MSEFTAEDVAPSHRALVMEWRARRATLSAGTLDALAEARLRGMSQAQAKLAGELRELAAEWEDSCGDDGWEWGRTCCATELREFLGRVYPETREDERLDRT